jgi:asparagine synthase (glutamine-hydrolysing)
MCGINGIVRLREDAPAPDRAELLRVRDSMAARGPDGEGEWISPSGRAALGHRRLAILDTSPAGAQPMCRGGRYSLVFNGEIFNFRELRDALARQGEAFATGSDTEVILALYAREGAAMLPRLRGMYALAVWDEAERTLFLARDPYGIKPLYYADDGGALRFASQVRALEASGAVPLEPDPAGLAGFLLWGSVPEPWTIRRAIRALPAGCSLTVRDGRVGEPLPHHDWTLEEAAAEPGKPRETVAEALAASVRAHLVSDVPVALFLSAGLDSALIAALARRFQPEPPSTFTLVFDRFAGTADDEGPLAAEIARTLGTRHTEARCGRDDLAALWPQALSAMDQPSIDGFNTFAVSRLVAEGGFKVALSGLGGDELFGSYPSFRDVPEWSRLAARWRRVPFLPLLFPAFARRLAPARPKLPGLLRYGRTWPGAYFLRRGLFLPSELPRLLGKDLAAEGLSRYDPLAEATRTAGGAGDPWTAVHRLESGLYMKNQLLRDADWAAMAHSLELRVPLVDPRLHRAVAAQGFEPARSAGKAALVESVAPELPQALFGRAKSGFSIPIAQVLGEAGAAAAGPRRPGDESRRLATAILEAFGVPLARGGRG